jgi:hypothetical protein
MGHGRTDTGHGRTRGSGWSAPIAPAGAAARARTGRRVREAARAGPRRLDQGWPRHRNKGESHATAGPPGAGRLGSNSRSFRLASSPHHNAEHEPPGKGTVAWHDEHPPGRTQRLPSMPRSPGRPGTNGPVAGTHHHVPASKPMTPEGGPVNKRSGWIWMICVPVLLLSGCGQGLAAAHGASLRHDVMPAARACRMVVGKAAAGFFTSPERVHLVLTTYAKGEPVESRGDISSGMPPRTLVWVVEVHAKAVHWDHSAPAGFTPSARPDTDYSVVMNARTGQVSDQGECTCWPLPLSTVGTVVSLPPAC